MSNNLAKKLLNNPGLIALTVSDEQKEIQSISDTIFKPRKIKFAFFQKDSNGGRTPYWHVNWKGPSDFGTTLSMEGLHRWKVI